MYVWSNPKGFERQRRSIIIVAKSVRIKREMEHFMNGKTKFKGRTDSRPGAASYTVASIPARGGGC